MNSTDFSCKNSTRFTEQVKPGELVWIQTYYFNEISEDSLMERCKVVNLSLYGKDENDCWIRDEEDQVGTITLEFIDEDYIKTFKVLYTELTDEETGKVYKMYPYTADALYLQTLYYFEQLAHLQSNNNKLCAKVKKFVKQAEHDLMDLSIDSIDCNIRH